MIVTIHQPEHLPWLGFFDKVRQADLFVILDHVPYRKNYFQNRNRIRSIGGFTWLTIPVHTKGKYGQPINEVQIANQVNPRWKQKCWKSIVQSYEKTSYFCDYAPFFESLYQAEWEYLVEINETIIHYLLSALDINVKVVRSSSLGVLGEKGDLLLDIARKVGATVYLSGVSGRDYLDFDQFVKAGVEVRSQKFYHPIYKQVYEPFIPCMSAIDMLFNCGPEAGQVLFSETTPRLDHVFE